MLDKIPLQRIYCEKHDIYPVGVFVVWKLCADGEISLKIKNFHT